MKKKIALIIAIPMISFLIYAVATIYQNYTNLASVKKVETFLRLTNRTHEVVNEIQKERGLSVGYVVSKDKSFFNLLKAQREKVDKSVDSLLDFLSDFDVSEFNGVDREYIEKISHIEKDIRLVRKEIDNTKSLNTLSIIKKYKPIIGFLQYFDYLLSMINNDFEISKIVNSYKTLQKTKNDAGIERGILYGAFTSNKLEAVNYNEFKNSVSSQNINIKNLIESSDEDIRNDLAILQENQEINKYRGLAFSKIKKSEIIAKIQSLIGYGGLIHQFKNYLLRSDEKYFNRFNKKYNQVIDYIQKYKSLKYVTKYELMDLKNIENTFTKYKDKLLELHEIKNGVTIKSLDERVRISDKDAIASIKNLNERFVGIDAKLWFKIATNRIESISNISRKISLKINKKIKSIYAKELFSIISIITVTLLLLLLTYLMVARMTNNFISSIENFKKGLENFFSYLNHDTKDIKPLAESDDELGKMARTINQNIQKIKADIEIDNKMISDLISCASLVKNGNLDTQITTNPSQNDLKRVKKVFNAMLKNLEEKIGKDVNVILQTLDQYSKFDYTNRIIDANGRVELAINELGSTIEQMLKENISTSSTLNNKSSALFSHVDVLKDSTNTQKELVEKSSKQLEEMIKNLSIQATKASQMATYSDEVNTSANIGTTLANQTTKAMKNMGQMVDQINSSIQTIDEIVVKTNILSLNASVEAVSAGEAGKGFSVVAAEVRDLAKSSADTSNDIKKIVKEAKDKSNEGIAIVKNMLDGYNTLMNNISKTMELINDTISISNLQEESVIKVQELIEQLGTQSSKTTVIVNETQNIAKETNEMAQKIAEEASK